MPSRPRRDSDFLAPVFTGSEKTRNPRRVKPVSSAAVTAVSAAPRLVGHGDDAAARVELPLQRGPGCIRRADTLLQDRLRRALGDDQTAIRPIHEGGHAPPLMVEWGLRQVRVGVELDGSRG